MRKILFLDRDGTLIWEPDDKQVDSLEKLVFLDNVIPALLEFITAGYELVMVSNQNGIGKPHFPEAHFNLAHEKMLAIFASQGIHFADVLICPHMAEDQCQCRKPKLGLLKHYLEHPDYDVHASYFIGDRQTDMQVAQGLGIPGILIGEPPYQNWQAITTKILTKDTHV